MSALTSPRGRSRDVECNVPREEQVIDREDSRIYLSLDFSAMGAPKILIFLSSQDRKLDTLFEFENAKTFIYQYFLI
ncbi:MAG: hypothetical protein MGF17_01430 [Trichodesmium sp. MAG_R04]|nr:hypothetical protein [Trichodesmium sp. MAG_R04]